ncbi:MAG: extracellular solute-binding protein [Paracoccaceae bacterium]
MVFGEAGSFDTLNPFNISGKTAAGITSHMVETLMARSIDEPFTLYGLIAESVETDAARSFVTFHLRPEARFSDGSPITVEDVIWSFETLGTEGHPRYRTAWAKVASIAPAGPHGLTISFTEPDRELPLLMGLRPILKKADWQGRDFKASMLEPFIGSGPYLIDRVDPGKSIRYRRNPEYWGKDLPINRGRHNLDQIVYDYYGDNGVLFQAFTAGNIDVFREGSASKWASAYDFARASSGAIVREEVPHSRPSGLTGLVMNSRNPLFQDWRVRQAMIEAFNFAFINQTMNGGVEPRITSYLSNSPLAGGSGPATGAVADLLAPYRDSLLPGTLEGYSLPEGDAAKSIDRSGLRRAAALLEEAGWSAEGGKLHDATGRPFVFEILLSSGSGEPETIATIYAEALKPLGFEVTISAVDGAQYVERVNRFAFDMTWFNRAGSLSPGNEQTLYWGAAGIDQPGSRNLMGMNSPAAEAMIKALVESDSADEARAAAQALDRIILAGRYVIPTWYVALSRLAYKKGLHHPERLPLYGDWPGFLPDVWWYEE